MDNWMKISRHKSHHLNYWCHLTMALNYLFLRMLFSVKVKFQNNRKLFAAALTDVPRRTCSVSPNICSAPPLTDVMTCLAHLFYQPLFRQQPSKSQWLTPLWCFMARGTNIYDNSFRPMWVVSDEFIWQQDESFAKKKRAANLVSASAIAESLKCWWNSSYFQLH